MNSTSKTNPNLQNQGGNADTEVTPCGAGLSATIIEPTISQNGPQSGPGPHIGREQILTPHAPPAQQYTGPTLPTSQAGPSVPIAKRNAALLRHDKATSSQTHGVSSVAHTETNPTYGPVPLANVSNVCQSSEVEFHNREKGFCDQNSPLHPSDPPNGEYSLSANKSRHQVFAAPDILRGQNAQIFAEGETSRMDISTEGR